MAYPMAVDVLNKFHGFLLFNLIENNTSSGNFESGVKSDSHLPKKLFASMKAL